MNANKKKIISLDGILRDDGYYDNWDFDNSTVKKYAQAINSSKIDYVETGFRNLHGSEVGLEYDEKFQLIREVLL